MTHQDLSRSIRRRWKSVTAAFLVLGIATECIARFVLGFGDPPRVLLDDAIEYYLEPSQICHRFGNEIAINAYSMRGPNFPPQKASPDELRVLVIGDSVVYGGHRVDQHNIATELLRDSLGAQLQRPVTVANIAASSWGPHNMLAFLERFGTFGADVAILVLSSHDSVDVPLFDAAVQPYWTRQPWCAAEDALVSVYERSLAPRIDRERTLANQTPMETRQARVLHATSRLLDRLEGDKIPVFMALHLERREVRTKPDPGHDAFLNLATQRKIPVIELGSAMKKAQEKGSTPFRDFIHPNAEGMVVMAQTFSDTIVSWSQTP